jgi:hypothetical protein
MKNEPTTQQPPTPQSNFLPIKLALQNLKEFGKDFETCKFVMNYCKKNFDKDINIVDEIFAAIDKLEENGNIFKNPSTKKFEWIRF